jgi:hypothetical protein
MRCDCGVCERTGWRGSCQPCAIMIAGSASARVWRRHNHCTPSPHTWCALLRVTNPYIEQCIAWRATSGPRNMARMLAYAVSWDARPGGRCAVHFVWNHQAFLCTGPTATRSDLRCAVINAAGSRSSSQLAFMGICHAFWQVALRARGRECTARQRVPRLHAGRTYVHQSTPYLFDYERVVHVLESEFKKGNNVVGTMNRELQTHAAVQRQTSR